MSLFQRYIGSFNEDRQCLAPHPFVSYLGLSWFRVVSSRGCCSVSKDLSKTLHPTTQKNTQWSLHYTPVQKQRVLLEWYLKGFRNINQQKYRSVSGLHEVQGNVIRIKHTDGSEIIHSLGEVSSVRQLGTFYEHNDKRRKSLC